MKEQYFYETLQETLNEIHTKVENGTSFEQLSF